MALPTTSNLAQTSRATPTPISWADQSNIGPVYHGSRIDPETGVASNTGAQKGTNAGQALKALQESSGLNLLGSYNASGSGAGQFGAGGAFPTIPAPDTTAANDAIFARAKDKTGQVGASALQGLHEALAGRGLLGGGFERQGTEQLAEAGAGELGNTVREQAIQQANQAMQNAQMGYQGSITQRGQSMQYDEAERARQAQLQAQQQQGLLSAINSSGILY